MCATKHFSEIDQDKMPASLGKFFEKRSLHFQTNDITLADTRGVLAVRLGPLDSKIERWHESESLADQKMHFEPMGSKGSGRTIPCGYLMYRGEHRSDSICFGYTQILGNGCIEATSKDFFADKNDNRYLRHRMVFERLSRALPRYMKGLHALDFTPPILLKVLAFEVKGVRLYNSANTSYVCCP